MLVSWGKKNLKYLKKGYGYFGNKKKYLNGIGFNIKKNKFGCECYENLERLNDCISKLKKLNINCVRTWGFNNFTLKILESLQKNNIKIQIGIWLCENNFEKNKRILQNVMGKISKFKKIIIGISLQNEQ